MDKFTSCFIGRRGGRVCPCCAEVGSNQGRDKARNTRAAKARFRVATRREIADALAGE